MILLSIFSSPGPPGREVPPGDIQNMPVKAAMATRPCFSSAWRYHASVAGEQRLGQALSEGLRVWCNAMGVP